MSKPGTTREQKECIPIYTNDGIQSAMAHTGRSRHSIKHKMKELNVKSTYNKTKNLKPIARKIYAEDVSEMFEMTVSGVKKNVIAEYFDTTSVNIRSVMCLARKHGFDAYPPRNKS